MAGLMGNAPKKLPDMIYDSGDTIRLTYEFDDLGRLIHQKWTYDDDDADDETIFSYFYRQL